MDHHRNGLSLPPGHSWVSSTTLFLPLSSSVSRHQTGNRSLTRGFGNAERCWQSQGWQVRYWGPGPTCLLSTLLLPAEHTFVSQAGNCSVREKTRDCDPEVTGLGWRPLWPETLELELRHPKARCGEARFPLQLEGRFSHARLHFCHLLVAEGILWWLPPHSSF